MANRIDWRIRVWSIDSICIERVCANTRPHPSKHNPTWRWCTWYAHKHTTRTTVYDLESILPKVFRRSKYNIKSSIIYFYKITTSLFTLHSSPRKSPMLTSIFSSSSSSSWA
jgi:hypothetical protein